METLETKKVSVVSLPQFEKCGVMHVKEQIQKLSTMLDSGQEECSAIKDRIRKKAKELFCSCGIRSITMDELAKQLSISKKTIYQSYEDKGQLVAEVFEREMKEKINYVLLNKERAENAIHEQYLNWEMHREQLVVSDPFIMHDLEKNHPEVHQRMKDFLNVDILKIVKENIERGINEELYRNDINSELIARFRVLSIIASMNNDLLPRSKFTVFEIERHLTLLFMHGMATPKGTKMIQKYFNK